jgi:hypothetical protein
MNEQSAQEKPEGTVIEWFKIIKIEYYPILIYLKQDHGKYSRE